MFAFIDILGLHCAILLFLFKLARFFCSFLFFFLNSLDIFNLTPKELKCVLIFLSLSIASHQRPFLTLCPSPRLPPLQLPKTTTRVLYNSAHYSPGQGKVLSLEYKSTVSLLTQFSSTHYLVQLTLFSWQDFLFEVSSILIDTHCGASSLSCHGP